MPRLEGYVYDEARGFNTNQTATAVSIDSGNSAHVSYYIEGPAGGDYEVQVSTDETNWYTHTSHAAPTTDQSGDLEIGYRYVRVQIVTASGTAGETANFVLSAAP